MSAIRLGCLVMASGQSKRFGSNKLLASFAGTSLLKHTLLQIPQDLFCKKTVVTRTPECCEIAQSCGFDALFHTLPHRSDAIRLGIEQMQGVDGCLFVQADQTLCLPKSYRALVQTFCCHPTGFVRLGYNSTVASPVLFPHSAFSALASLPAHKGGAAAIPKNSNSVFVVQAKYEWELWDADTPDDLRRLAHIRSLFPTKPSFFPFDFWV